MTEFTFLNKSQIFKETMLNVFKLRGTKAETTDFALLLGARKNTWWTKDSYSLGLMEIKGQNGIDAYDCRSRIVGARPAVPFSEISDEFKNLTRKEDGVIEVECGEYPQTIASVEISEELEILYKKDELKKTNKTYTVDKRDLTDYRKGFEAKELDEYTYKGKKYVRIEGNNNNFALKLSNKERVMIGKGYWVEVEPIKWLIDEKTFLAVSEKVLFAGVRYDALRNYENVFCESEIKQYMDNYFAKEMIPSKEKTKEKVKVMIKK